MTSDNFIDNPKGIFGYPINVTIDRDDHFQLNLIPEILSYEGFQS